MKKGFTLVELSIVLVIIGLLIGGILVGQSLIRTAEINSVGSQVEQIQIAIRLFKDRFKQLPGDSNKMWGYYGTDCASVQSRCDGANNGLIQTRYYRVTHGYGENAEDMCVYRHIAMTGFWDGESSAAACSVDGVSLTTLTSNPEIVPTTIDDLYLTVGVWDLYVGGRNDNAISITSPSAGFGGAYMIGGGLKRLDAMAIENKFDDGVPTSGEIYVSRGIDGARCVTGTSNYVTQAASGVDWWQGSGEQNAPDCNLHFWIND